MRGRWFGIAMAACQGATALGGVILFDPPVTEVDIAEAPSAVVNMSTYLIAEGGLFDNVTALIRTDDWIEINMTYSTQFLDHTLYRTPTLPTDRPPGPVRPECCPHDLLIGGYSFAYRVATPAQPYLVGTLTVGLPPSEITVGQRFTFLVDSNRDGGFSSIGAGLNSEPLIGMGEIRVVPEPGAVGLLLMGAAALGWRRRRAPVGKPPVAPKASTLLGKGGIN